MSSLGIQSRAVHDKPVRESSSTSSSTPTPLIMPIYTSSTYRLASADHAARLCSDEASESESNYLYSRWANPTCRSVAQHIAELEHGYDAHMTASGIAAVSSVFLTFLSAGDHVVPILSYFLSEVLEINEELEVISHTVYGGTHELTQHIISRFGVEFTWLDDPSVDNYRRAVKPNTKLLYAETPSNPNLRCVDLAGLGALSKELGIISAVDSTFASPVVQQPISHGFDIVIHSCTKYLGGHSDLIGGVIVSRTRELWNRLNLHVRILGAVLSPHDAFLIERGIKTLPLRMAAHNSNALAIARFLEKHPKVEFVLYPGLESHQDHAIASKQMQGGFGGMVAFDVKGGVEAGRALIEHVKLITLAVSLGGVESLICHAASTTHVHVSRAERLSAGITDGLIRLSVGIESVEDLIADLSQALNAV